MEELVKMVASKTGISPDTARTAVTTVVGYLKGKLPPAIAGQIDGLLAGSGAGNPLEGMGDTLGGMFKK